MGRNVVFVFIVKQKLGRYSMLLAVVPILMELRKRQVPLANEFKKDKKLMRLERMENVLNEIEMENQDVSYLFRGLPNDHFLCTENMMFILQIKLMRLDDLDFNIEESDTIYEISPVSIEEKIAWLTIAIYSMATEKSFIEFGLNSTPQNALTTNQKKTREIRIPDSEVDLGKALELGYVFQPHDQPFVTHIFNVYARTQNTGNMAIPEDKQIDEQIKLIKPLNGGFKSNLIIPLIRNNKNAIQHNDAFQKKKLTHDGTSNRKVAGINLPHNQKYSNVKEMLSSNGKSPEKNNRNAKNRALTTNSVQRGVGGRMATQNAFNKTNPKSKPGWFVGSDIMEMPEFKARTISTNFSLRKKQRNLQE